MLFLRSKNQDKGVNFLTAFKELLIGIPIEGANSNYLANHDRLNQAILAWMFLSLDTL